MSEILHKRVMPASVLAAVILAVLLLVQLFLVSGGLETETLTVRKTVPWLYKPFLRLVGEHPDTRPSWLGAEGEEVETSSQSGLETIAGFAPEELSIDLNVQEGTNDSGGAESIDDRKTIVPVSIPEAAPAEIIDEDIPVG